MFFVYSVAVTELFVRDCSDRVPIPALAKAYVRYGIHVRPPLVSSDIDALHVTGHCTRVLGRLVAFEVSSYTSSPAITYLSVRKHDLRVLVE